MMFLKLNKIMSPQQNSLFYWHTVSAKISFPLLFARLYFVWCRTIFSLLLFISKIVKQSNMCDALKVCLAELARSTNVAKEYFKRQTLDSKPAQRKYVLIANSYQHCRPLPKANSTWSTFLSETKCMSITFMHKDSFY